MKCDYYYVLFVNFVSSSRDLCYSYATEFHKESQRFTK